MSSLIELPDREVYLYSEIDAIVGLAAGTARRWINGYTRAGTDYAPILRVEPRATEWATWGEFVETRILAEYRSQKIPTLRLRGAVEKLREIFAVRYPLAHLEPYLAAEDDGTFVLEAGGINDQTESAMILQTGQALLDIRSRRVIRTATFEHGASGTWAMEIEPDLRFRGIVVNPARSGGQPTLQGRRASVTAIANLVRAGERRDRVALDFGISLDQVQAAVDFSTRQAA